MFGFTGFVGSISAYAILFSNFGIETYATRLLAADREALTKKTMGVIFGTRSLLAIALIIPFIAFGFYYSQTVSEQLFFIFESVIILVYAFNLQYFFVSIRDVRKVAVIRTGSAALVLVASYCFIHSPADVQYNALIGSSVTLVFFLWGVVHAFRKLPGAFSFPSFSEMRGLVRDSLPLGVSALMIQIYHSADIVFLGFTNPGTQLGYYTGAYRIINLISAVPGLIYLTYIPDLATITEAHPAAKTTREYIAAVIALGIVIVGLSFYFSKEIITIILGAHFAPANTVFRILLINVLIIYINVAFAHLLMAWGENRSYLYVVSTGAAVNIVMNVVLIPHYGINGAAIATACAEAAVFVAAWRYLRKKFQFSLAKLLRPG